MSRPWPSRRGSRDIAEKATVAAMRALALGLLTVLAAGCGASEADRVRAKVGELGRDDPRGLCRDVLAPDLVAAAVRATGRSCEAIARELVGRRAPHATRVRVDGDLATARVGRETLTLVRTRAGWRVASLGDDGGPSRP